MENATKALLIAAGVLIVILLIALGMNIFNSVDDTSGQAGVIGGEITSQTDDATKKAMEAMGYVWVEDTDATTEGNQPGYIKNN